ncbi:DNA polymerase III subunit psi [Methylophaga sp.]|uniref:DNA polymerase III subunit psi n=1 Tax=Methylophaga sp. TaxID=2024840 RepID=UPI00272087BD|nr:DNA polymerase III subunit psi [Methylophaga sp.]MDO8825617.1 DNA polymerase III subunit psi [Methylophaga sp.]
MSLSAHQYFVLDQMGIPVWVPRDEDDAVTTADFSSETSDFNQFDFAKPWLVITENQLSVAESRLLRAIFGSINILLSDVAVLEKQHLNVLTEFAADKTVALVLGEELSQKLNLKSHSSLSCQQLDNDLLTMVSPSLQTLLEQPQRKAEMWQSILQLRNLRAYLSD